MQRMMKPFPATVQRVTTAIRRFCRERERWNQRWKLCYPNINEQRLYV